MRVDGEEPAERSPGWSIRAHLALVVGLALLAMLAITAFTYRSGTSDAKRQADRELRDHARRATSAIELGLTQAATSVATLAAQPGVLDVLTQQVPACSLVAEGTVAFPEARVDVVRKDGAVGCSSDPRIVDLSRRPHRASPWLRSAVTTPTGRFLDVVDGVTGERSVVITAQLGPAGAPVGAAVLVLPEAQVGASLARALAGPDRESFTVLDGAGRDITSSETSAAGAAAPQAAGEHAGRDGVSRRYANRAVSGTPWHVLAGRRTSVIVADTRSLVLRQSALGAVVMLALLAAAVVLDRRVAGPVRRLRTGVAVARLSEGRERVPERGASELADLAAEFNAMQDIRAGQEARLQHLATHDVLTGLPNRLGVQQAVERLLFANHAGALLSLGIDRFRILNESLGSDAADDVLVQVAARLGDVLQEGELLARFRGDEFVVFSPGVDSAAAGMTVARRLLGALREPFRGHNYDVAVSATAGIAVIREWRPSLGQLLREADLAMHQAKRAGRDLSVYESQGTRAHEHLQIERQLRGGMERGELALHYQPLVDLSSGAAFGAEALIRWNHPERGLVQPADFLPVAEQTGQIVEIGRIALRLACEQMRAWSADGRSVPVSVNVAVDQLRSGDLPDLVEQELAQAGVEPASICLELTERSLVHDLGSVRGQLRRLHDLGVRIAIDDFGTGYSSLAYLQDLPVDRLKVDIAFVRRVTRDERARHLVGAIVDMAQALDLDVVAEGVETPEQRDALGRLGCKQAQGFLFGRPMPADEFVAHLQPHAVRRSLRSA